MQRFYSFILFKMSNTSFGDNDVCHDDEVVALIRLSCCGLLPADLEKVWRSLGTSSDVTLLE